MNDSRENLALSTTFVWHDGEISQGSSHQGANSAETMLQPGMVVDSKYQIIGLIAYGGIGAVYKAHHLLLQKDMALKTFLSQGFSSASWLRFQREAQAIAKLKHKGIVDVFDFGVAEGQMPYYTMELLEGKSLAHAIYKSGRIDPSESMRLFAQIADALAHAHRQNIVHRDIKPANIMLIAPPPGQKGPRQAKLVDFGVAKLAVDENQEHTQAGTVFGSPLYMSPEQSLGLPTDHRTDIYSFGCALYEALTGSPPFVGDTAIETMHCHQVKMAPSLKASEVECAFSSRLEATVAKLLAKKPEERFQSFDEVIVELERCANNVQRQTVQNSGTAYGGTLAGDKSGKAGIGAGGANAKAGIGAGGANAKAGMGVGDMNAKAGIGAGGMTGKAGTGVGGMTGKAGTRDGDMATKAGTWSGDMATKAGTWSGAKGDKMTALVTTLSKKPVLLGLSLLVVCALAGTIVLSRGLVRGNTAPALSRMITADTDTVVSSDSGLSRAVKVIPISRHYFYGLRKDKDGLKKLYDFPADEQAGTISLEGEHTVYLCSGRVVVPAGAKLVLNAGEGPFTRPELFRRFLPDDLYGISLTPQVMSSKEGDWSDKHIEEISRLTGLQSLDVSRALSLSPNIAKSLNKLKNLKRLILSYSCVKNDTLEALTILPQLEYLNISGDYNLTAVFTEMSKKNCRLQALIANYCGFQTRDFQLIGGFKRLQVLSAVGCGITDKAIAHLTPAATLESINLSQNQLDDGAIPSLGRYRSLKDLSITLRNFSAPGRARLKQAVPPGCTVDNLEDQ